MKYLTEQIPGIGGKIKQFSQDFQVREKLSFPTSGYGDYLYIEIEKRDITTFEVISFFCRQLKIKKSDIGYAGLKDAKAITRQSLSLFKVEESSLECLDTEKIKIIRVSRHHKKLKKGNLSGNFFSITIRNSNLNVNYIEKTLDILKQKGVPNYFGKQRFGNFNNTHLLGKHLIQKDYESFISTLFPSHQKTTLEFIELFHQKRYYDAFKSTPKHFHLEKKCLHALHQNKKISSTINSIPREMKFLYICAYQSYLFNIALEQRLKSIHTIEIGDLAVLHPTRSVFLVTDKGEQLRCSKNEISPSGPLFGYKMIQPTHLQKEIEQEILLQERLDVSLFSAYKIRGERRSYRFFLDEIHFQKINDEINISFFLAKSCYATIVLREIMKEDVAHCSS